MKRTIRTLWACAELNPCICKTPRPMVDTDPNNDHTFIECCQCGRCVGGLDREEAFAFWNTIMETGGTGL